MLKTVTLQFVKNEQKVSKAGKPYTACSIKVSEDWVNGFGSPATQAWQVGDSVMLDIYEEEWNGKMYKKFKVPDKADLLEKRVSKLEEAVFKKQLSVAEVESIMKTDLPFDDPTA